jgi:SIR2-like protein
MHNKYTTILIGNGLGMAVDPDHFRIDAGLNHAWMNLPTEQQDRIKNLITGKSALNSEEQLDKHYAVIQACLMLNKIESHSNLEWLHPNAKKFPENFRNFIADTAWHFFEYSCTDSDKNAQLNKFIENLKSYISNNNTHLATLNYDGLIYDRIVNSEIMNPSGGKLIDGFYIHQGGFHPSRLSGDNRCYYLHLHGSPLFYSDFEKDIINKDSYKTFAENKTKEDYLREHLILCKTSLKLSRITSSPLLNSYWDFFKSSLFQSHKIILIGYSGNDPHVNTEISNVRGGREIIIIEYSDQSVDKKAREKDWSIKLQLGNNYFNDSNLIWLDSILDYDFNNTI